MKLKYQTFLLSLYSFFVFSVLFLLVFPHINNVKAQIVPTIVGNVDVIRNNLCSLEGWTKDLSTTNSISVRFYKDGPMNQGTFLAEGTANILRTDLPYPDQNHGFLYQFDVSTSLLDDNKDHTIYTYGYNPNTGLYGNLFDPNNPPTIHCQPYTSLSINTGEPYSIGAWYFTAWSSLNDFQALNAQNVFGSFDPWGGVRQYATGQDPWGLYTFVSNPTSLKQYYAGRQPLLGFYDLTNQSVMDNHIKQAASRGLSYFAFYWYWDLDKNQESPDSTPLHNFIASHQKNKLKFMLAPIMIGNTPFSLTVWQNNIVPYIVNNYIGDSSYLTTTDGRPIINDFDMHVWSDETTHLQALNILRSAVQAKTGKNPVIFGEVSNLPYPTSVLSSNNAAPQDYDGYQCFQMAPQKPSDPFTNAITYWQTSMTNLKRFFHVPCGTVGFDDRPWYKIGWGGTSPTTFDQDKAALNARVNYTNINLSTFKQHLQQQKSYLDQHPQQTGKMFTIYAWNEWGEGGIIEPSTVNRYQYLNTIQNVFGLTSKSRVP